MRRAPGSQRDAELHEGTRARRAPSSGSDVEQHGVVMTASGNQEDAMWPGYTE